MKSDEKLDVVSFVTLQDGDDLIAQYDLNVSNVDRRELHTSSRLKWGHYAEPE